jgi:3-hydroxyisobutyrate dehydrogenase-like beta-hydroxyacid dehydrogenase
MSARRRIAIIGFGEAGSILGEDLARGGSAVVAYDILMDVPAARAAMLRKAERVGVHAAASPGEAFATADLVISAVTASSSVDVAAAAGAALRPGQIFLDINSVAPSTKRKCARIVEQSGAEYVEAAVMAPVPPQRLAVPMLLGGRSAGALAAELRALGMHATEIASEIGVASAVKMCRSIVIKGLEALTLESMLAARRFGAEREVLASLEQSFPHMGWADALPDYLVSRIAEHGRRRAAEMREVVRTLGEIGIEPTMAEATALRQDALIDDMQSRGWVPERDVPFSWRALADALAPSATEAAEPGNPKVKG